MRFRWFAYAAIALQLIILVASLVVRVTDIILEIVSGASLYFVIGWFLGFLIYALSGWAVIGLALYAVVNSGDEE